MRGKAMWLAVGSGWEGPPRAPLDDPHAGLTSKNHGCIVEKAVIGGIRKERLRLSLRFLMVSFSS